MRYLLFVVTTAALALGSAAIAQETYGVGDKVEAYSSMSGRWEAGKIVALDGGRYMFQADDKTLANGFWGSAAASLRRPQGPAATPQQPTPAPRVVAVAPASRIAAAAAPAGGCAEGAGGKGAVKIAGARPAPLGGGLFPNGQPLGTPGQTNFMNNKRGQKSIVAVAPPGADGFVGRFNLMVGGTWSTASSRDLGGGVTERTLEWNVPAAANALIINADHSWFRKSGSQRFSGRWIELGQNVAQLIGYDGDDWTGSIQRWRDGSCQMEMRGPLGQNEWGRRF